MNTRRNKRRRLIHPKHEISDSEDEEYNEQDIMNNARTRRKFLEVRAEIKKTEPDVMRILHADILLTDKAELLQLFELYKTMEFSEDQISLKNRIYQKLIKAEAKYAQHNSYTNKQHKQFEQEIQQLEAYNEGEEIKYAILSLNTSRRNKSVIYNNYKRLQTLPPDGDEYYKLKNWLKWAISLPHDDYITFPFNKRELTSELQTVAKRLDDELYGMQSVKEQILVFISAKIRNPHMKKCSLGLIGPPGTGKTRICSILADVLGFPFEQISMGGVTDPTFLKGNRSLYIGSEPGEIVKTLKRMGKKNGILFLDEYDKIQNPDVSSALLHITDSSQNSTFTDTFLSGITIDLSYLWFVYSMNKLPTDDAVADRIFAIQVEPYSRQDKTIILRNYMLPQALRNVKMDVNSVKLPEKNAEHIVDIVSPPNEPGARSLEKAINSIVNKVSFLKNHQDRHGNLAFNISFNTGKINFPLTLTKTLIDSCLQPRLQPRLTRPNPPIT